MHHFISNRSILQEYNFGKIIKINNIVIYRETIGNIRERGTSFRGHFEMSKKGNKSYTSIL
jgi:hypothetical protein